MKKYKTLKDVRLNYFFVVLLFGYFTITGAPIIGSILLTYVVFVLLLAGALYEIHSIEINKDNKIRFNKILFSKTYEIKDIIKFQRGTMSCDYIVFNKGKKCIPAFLEDTPGLRATLKEINPGIEAM